MSYPPPPPTGPPTGPPSGPPPGWGPPPGFPPGPPPGFPPGPPRPQPKRRGPLIAIVVAVVVLLIAAGVGLVVWQPWADDDSQADDQTTRSESAEQEPSSDATQDTTAPSASAEPAGPTRVRGDLTGDGLGDLLTVYYPDNKTALIQQWEGGESEVAVTDETPLETSNLAYGDFDADGTVEELQIEAQGEPGEVTITAEDVEVSVLLLDVPRKLGYVIPRVGDFTGDGTEDLLVISSDEHDNSTLTLLPGSPDGLGEPTAVGSIDKGRVSSIFLDAEDFDGDGLDDLLVSSPALELPTDLTQTYEGPYEYRVYRSTGTAIGAVGDPAEEVSGVFQGVGRFTREGPPLIVTGDRSGTDITFRFYGFTASGLTEVQPLATEVPNQGEGGTSRFGIADADGDGLDDLVVSIDDESPKQRPIQLIRSTGSGFDEPVDWGEAPCDATECTFYFFDGAY